MSKIVTLLKKYWWVLLILLAVIIHKLRERAQAVTSTDNDGTGSGSGTGGGSPVGPNDPNWDQPDDIHPPVDFVSGGSLGNLKDDLNAGLAQAQMVDNTGFTTKKPKEISEEEFFKAV